MPRHLLFLALLAASLGAVPASWPLLAEGPQQAGAVQAPDEPFTMALTGDAIITRPLSIYQEPPFLEMIDLIRRADVAFTNLEVLFHDFEPYPMHQSGGTYMRADPALARELAWAGFDLVARANNHTGDYGVLGMHLTTKHVAEAGLVGAGAGDSLREAREAKFLDTPKGRVALVSVASTFPDHSRAGRSAGDIPARPGLSPLRFRTTYVVTRDRLESLRGMLRELGLNAPAEGDSLNVLRNRFEVGDSPDVRTEPLEADVEEIAAVVRSASTLADYTLVTIHAHEGDRDRFVPAQFLVTFARAMIDAGADLFVGHGPHVLRGIELYKNRPIFYSLANFVFQNETLLRFPADNYEDQDLDPSRQLADYLDARYDHDRRSFPADPDNWESVIAVPEWRGKVLTEIRLHPISLGYGQSRASRGRPTLAEPELAAKILQDLQRRSTPFGTTIAIEGDVGVIRLGVATAGTVGER